MRRITNMLLVVSVVLLVAATAQATLYSDHVTGRTDLIAYYELNGFPPVGTLPDSSGNGNTGVQNAIIYRGQTGPGTADGWDGLGTSNQHYDFRGVGDISLGASAQTAAELSTMTFSAMVRMDGNSVIYEAGTGTDNPFQIQHWNNSGYKIYIKLGDGSARGFGQNALSDAEWHHLVVTRSGTDVLTDVAVYVDGVAMSQTALGAGSMSTADAIRIGARADGTQRADGGMDEVALFNTELSASDVTDLYNAAIPEPATMTLLGVGGLLALVRRRRK